MLWMVLVKGQIFGLRKISDSNLSESQTPLNNIKILLIKRINLQLHKLLCLFEQGCVTIPPWKTAKAFWFPTGPTLVDLPGYHMGNQFMKPKTEKEPSQMPYGQTASSNAFTSLGVLLDVWVEWILSPDQILCQTSTRSSLGRTSQVREDVFDLNSFIF